MHKKRTTRAHVRASGVVSLAGAVVVAMAFSCGTPEDGPMGDLLGGKGDGVHVDGRHESPGMKLPASLDQKDTAVWEVKNQWEDITPEAGPENAWPANSGLNFDQKYSRWVGSLKKMDPQPQSGSRFTYEMTTPWGKKLPALNSDCADAWLFLRATFAAWYNLPFLVISWEPCGSSVRGVSCP